MAERGGVNYEVLYMERYWTIYFNASWWVERWIIRYRSLSEWNGCIPKIRTGYAAECCIKETFSEKYCTW